MSTIVGNYYGKYTGERVDELLTRVDEGTDLVPIVEELGKKADIDGKYPELTSGFASQLVGRGESVEAEIGGIRASGGKSILDGSARIKELRGNAVVWNQQLHITSSGQYQSNGVTFNVTAELGEVVANGSASTANATRGVPIPNTIAGHRYFLFGCPNGGSASSYYITDQANAFDYGGGVIYTARTTGLTFVVVTIVEGASVNNLKFYPKAIDLTQMFGSGKEPSTIEEFYARCPIGVDMKAYNEGEMIADNSTAIKSVGDNAWDEEWELGSINPSTGAYIDSTTQIRSKNFSPMIGGVQYVIYCPSVVDTNSRVILYDGDYNIVDFLGFTVGKNRVLDIPSNVRFFKVSMATSYGAIYNNDITISLYHSGWKAEVDNVYKPYVEFTREIDQRILDAFPNGRKPWDKVYNKNGKGYIVKGTGEVDMGSLNWRRGNGDNYTSSFRATLLGSESVSVDNRCLSPKYDRFHATSTSAWVDNAHPNMIRIHGGYVGVNDPQYTDAATFKTAMSGVMLWYELAEPEIIEYDEPFNLDYEVWDFGTEQAISDNPSAPINADIIYQFNAVDMIREHESEITALQEQIAALQTALASLTSGGE